LLQRKWLHEVRGRPAVHHLQHHAPVVIRAHDHEWRVSQRVPFAHSLAQSAAVHVWHADIADDDVRRLALQNAQGFDAVAGGEHREPGLDQPVLQGPQDEGGVVHDEHGSAPQRGKPSQHVLDPRDEVIVEVALDNIGSRANVEPPLDALFRVDGAQNDDRRGPRRGVLLKPLAELKAIHEWHLDVADDQVERLRRGEGQPFDAILSRRDHSFDVFQESQQQAADHATVVDNQNARVYQLSVHGVVPYYGEKG